MTRDDFVKQFKVKDNVYCGGIEPIRITAIGEEYFLAIDNRGIEGKYLTWNANWQKYTHEKKPKWSYGDDSESFSPGTFAPNIRLEKKRRLPSEEIEEMIMAGKQLGRSKTEFLYVLDWLDKNWGAK